MNEVRKNQLQRMLLEVAVESRFYQTKYDSKGLPMVVDRDVAKPIAPKSAKCNEVAEDLSVDQNYGRGLRLQTDSHYFDLLLEFNVEVDSSAFTEHLKENVPKLAATGGNPGVMAILTSAEYNHPTTKDSSNGSRIKFTFEAVEGRS